LQFDKSEKCIIQSLEAETATPSSEALQSLTLQAKLYSLLAQVHERSGESNSIFKTDILFISSLNLFMKGNIESSIQTLGKAKEMRSKVLKRIQVEQPDVVLEQKQLTAKVG